MNHDEEAAQLGLEMVGVRRVPNQNVQQPVNLSDPQAVPWGRIAQEFQLSDEEVQQLQVELPEGGPGLAERLQRLRPQMNLGGLNVQLEDNGVSGSYRW